MKDVIELITFGGGFLVGSLVTMIIVVTTLPSGNQQKRVCDELYSRTLTTADSLYLTTNTYCKIKTTKPN